MSGPGGGVAPVLPAEQGVWDRGAGRDRADGAVIFSHGGRAEAHGEHRGQGSDVPRLHHEAAQSLGQAGRVVVQQQADTKEAEA